MGVSEMRLVIQRVKESKVIVNGSTMGSIGIGLLVLIGISREDTRAEADYMLDKLTGLRVFPDDSGHYRRSEPFDGVSVGPGTHGAYKQQLRIMRRTNSNRRWAENFRIDAVWHRDHRHLDVPGKRRLIGLGNCNDSGKNGALCAQISSNNIRLPAVISPNDAIVRTLRTPVIVEGHIVTHIQDRNASLNVGSVLSHANIPEDQAVVILVSSAQISQRAAQRLGVKQNRS